MANYDADPTVRLQQYLAQGASDVVFEEAAEAWAGNDDEFNAVPRWVIVGYYMRNYPEEHIPGRISGFIQSHPGHPIVNTIDGLPLCRTTFMLILESPLLTNAAIGYAGW